MAVRKRRQPIGWFVVGFVLLLLGVLLAYAVPKEDLYDHGRATREAARAEREKATWKRGPPKVLEFTKCTRCGTSLPPGALMCGTCGQPTDTLA